MRKPAFGATMLLCVALMACGGSDEETSNPNGADRPVGSQEPPEPALARPKKAPEPALARPKKKPGEIVLNEENAQSLGPFAFPEGIYRVRLQQYAPDMPGLDFRTESSSFVVQLHRQPGKIDAETIHVFNVTKPRAQTNITSPGGKFYVDVSSADHSFVLRFTPQQ